MSVFPTCTARIRSFALALAVGIALAVPSAQASEGGHLTEGMVENFVDSMTAVRQWADSQDDLDKLEDMEMEPGTDAMTSPFSAAVTHMETHGRVGELESIVRDHGFDGMDEWGRVGDRVVRAFMAVEIEREHPEARAELEEARREIEDNPDIPEAQKEQLLEMLEASAGAMMSMIEEVPEADREALRPHLPRLRETMGEDAR